MAERPPCQMLEQVLGYRFAQPEILQQALTHRGSLGAVRKDQGQIAPGAGNERLEFLGDRVLGLVIAEALLRTFPDENEGALASRLAALVSAPALAQVAAVLNLQDYVIAARGQSVDAGVTAVLADACEAVIGAIYLDGGLGAAAAFITAHWNALIKADLVPPKDAKTALQEWAQGRGLPLPVYRVLESSGPDHAPSFTMAVNVKGFPDAVGQGRTKRLATQAAASALLQSLSGQTP